MAGKTIGEEREKRDRQEWNAIVSGDECFRKNNIRIVGSLRLLRFKIGKNRRCAIPFHEREKPLLSFRIKRVAFALVWQNGDLAVGQKPIVSDRNAIVRLKLALVRAIQAPVLLFAGLFMKRRKFSHFLLLGYNCEMAFRFVRANGFIDSTFFAWAGGLRCEKMLKALERFDEVLTGEMVLRPGTRDVFTDVETEVSMHAHYNAGEFAPGSSEMPDLESAKAEVRSRAAYLREKFYRQLRDEEPTLAVIKMMSVDCPSGDEYARRFVSWLRERGGRNFQFLVICQKKDAVHFPAEHPDYFLRTVSRYNPEWFAATEQFGDRLGWNMIWKEFAPAKRLAGKKKFKFDGAGGRDGR